MSDNQEVELTEEVVEEVQEEVVEEVQEEVVEEPPKPKRGRPKGSRHKPKVQVVSLEEEEPIELIDEAAPEPPPQAKRQPRARARAPPQAPEPPSQIDIAAFMLIALRQQQQERADRKRDKYSNWFS